MHAAQESKLSQPMKVGIIAGSGRPPLLLAEALEREGHVPYIIALDGSAEPELYQTRKHLLVPIGRAGRIIKWLKENGVTELVLSGALKRPEWAKLKVDPRGLMFVAKVALKALGDDGLLRAIRFELEKDGFHLRGIHEFMPELLAPEGVLGSIEPLAEDQETIRLGYDAAKEHGRQDKGQSVVVQQETVLGLEGDDGTAALMARAAKIKSVGRGPILVKVCKPQQDLALDLPTIGINTVESAREGGYAGIAVEAGLTLIIDLANVVLLCDRYGLFIVGLPKKD
jgi:hypothetical protein